MDLTSNNCKELEDGSKASRFLKNKDSLLLGKRNTALVLEAKTLACKMSPLL